MTDKTSAGSSKTMVDQFHDMLHRDHTGLVAGLHAVLGLVGGYQWARSSRGSYEWDDDRFHAEMGNMLDAVSKAANEALDRYRRGPLECCALERATPSETSEPPASAEGCTTCGGSGWIGCECPVCTPEKASEDLCAVCDGVFIDHRHGALGHDWQPKKPLAETYTARTLVAKQAEDEGLWIEAQTVTEAYLQQELRKLHAAVEGTFCQPPSSKAGADQ